jgi:hypothetical protein
LSAWASFSVSKAMDVMACLQALGLRAAAYIVSADEWKMA